MQRLTFLALVTAMLSLPLQAAEVTTIVSCKADGEVWLCGAWRNGRVEVFRSETYFSMVEFGAETEAQLQAAIEGHQTGRTAEHASMGPTYTLQILACRSDGCIDRSPLRTLKESRVIELVRNGQHWQVLVVGEYPTTKAAQLAAAKLMTKYRLTEKPWVRTLDSLERQRLRP